MTDDDDPGIEALIVPARLQRDVLGRLFERYRPFLLLVAQQQIGRKLAVRCDPLDVVQQTLAEAHQAFPCFKGSCEPEFSAWIKRIHYRNLANVVRQHVSTERRSLERERSLSDPEGTASFCWQGPASDGSTPSQHFIQGERALRLATMLQTLPEMQREAVRLRHIEGWSVERIAQELDRSLAATAGLIKRGLQALREKMSADSWL